MKTTVLWDEGHPHRGWVALVSDSSHVLGMVAWDDNGISWMWHPNQEPNGEWLYAQAERRDDLLMEKTKLISSTPEGPMFDALMAELDGRVAAYRDETREAAVFMARVKAKALLADL